MSEPTSGAPAASLLPAAAQLAWLAACQPEYARFESALHQPAGVQRALLESYLEANRDTAYGRAHDFAGIETVEEYQARVPLVTWDQLEPWIERVAAGEPGVLTREPVRMLEPSSGSTRAAKLIPYTATLQREFSRALGAWMCDLHGARPALLGGPSYWSITPLQDRPARPATAVPIGFEEDSAYLGGSMQALVNRTLAVPGAMRHVTDPARFRHRTLLFLLRCRELRMVSIWHPSFLSLLLDSLEETWEALLADLRAGVEAEVPELSLAPDPARAGELADLDPRRPAELWPRLALVSCWADGPAARAARALEARLGGIELQPKGLLATEAFVTLPFRGSHPLAVASHFFELIDEAGAAHLVHEVEDGQRYSVVVTTGGGLYRYRLQDQVEVVGHLGATPCLRFLGKLDRIVDLRGEKLSEGLVAAVLEGLLAAADLSPAFVLLSPEDPEGTPGYVLHLELDEAPPPGTLEALAGRLQAALAENPHYRLAVDLGQLRPARVARTAPGAAGRYLERLRRRGQRLGDVKPAVLSPLEGWDAWLRGTGSGDLPM